MGMTVELHINFCRCKAKPGDIYIKGSRSFSEIPHKDHLKLFLHKITECSKICDYSDSTADLKAKSTKNNSS